MAEIAYVNAMGRTNLRHGLKKELSHLLGELEAAESEYSELRTSLQRLVPLREKIRDLKSVVDAAQTLLSHVHPDWDAESIKPTRVHAWKAPFKLGEQGQRALSTLRASGGWLRPREVAEIMLRDIGHDPADAEMLHRVTNSVGMYLKKYEGTLVEARGSYTKEWRVIR